MIACGVRCNGGGCCDIGGKLSFHVEALPEWRDRGGDDAFGEAFVFDEGDVKHTNTTVAAGSVAVFTADLEV